MVSRRNSPGLGQWLTVSLIVILVMFLLYKLLQYGGFRQNYPAGLTIAGVDVGGFNQGQAESVLSDRYLNAPVIIYHGENRIEIPPTQVDFELDIESMFSNADYEKAQQDYWSGFWGFLWGQPVEIGSVGLIATHDQDALVAVLETIKLNHDVPAQPAQPVPGGFQFQSGEAGVETDVEASLGDVTSALYRPTEREAFLTLRQAFPDRPGINLLARLIVNNTQEFEQVNGGLASIFILDLTTGDEISLNADTAMSGMGLLKTAIALEAFRVIDQQLSVRQSGLISETLLAVDDEGSNELLGLISGIDDPEIGAANVTQSLQQLGLMNSYIIAPYGDSADNVNPLETPANSIEGLPTSPTPALQTTAEDMGSLFTMIYHCAQGSGGAIAIAFDGAVTQQECEQMMSFMALNSIGSLLEQGVPEDASLAHRHGWIDDTHGDAGIVQTDSSSYVIVQIMYKPSWLEWEISSPLIANISQATYNFFNFDDPFQGVARSN